MPSSRAPARVPRCCETACSGASGLTKTSAVCWMHTQRAWPTCSWPSRPSRSARRCACAGAAPACRAAGRGGALSRAAASARRCKRPGSTSGRRASGPRRCWAMSTRRDRRAGRVVRRILGAVPCSARRGAQVEARILAGPQRDLGNFLRALQRLETAITFLSQHRCAVRRPGGRSASRAIPGPGCRACASACCRAPGRSRRPRAR